MNHLQSSVTFFLAKDGRMWHFQDREQRGRRCEKVKERHGIYGLRGDVKEKRKSPHKRERRKEREEVEKGCVVKRISSFF